MSKHSNDFESSALVIKAIIVCDDLTFADKASASLRRVGQRAGIDAYWTIRCWPADALNEKSLAEKALVGALDAQLIVVPASLAQSVPLWLLDWLERWAVQRHIREAALGIVDIGDATCVEILDPELSDLVHSYGLAFIGKESLYARDLLKQPFHFVHGGQNAALAEQRVFGDPDRWVSCRTFGINE